MNITLIEHTPNPERTVALAARLCYSPTSIDDLREKLAASDIESFLDKIMSLGHHSVLEHASFTFGIEGISRVTTHQLVRHRIASFSQQSQRYVSHKDQFTSIMPACIAENPEARQIFDLMSETVHKAYAQLIEMGIPAEDARYILPNATETKIIMTMNARELLH
ncbi:MAG: FAD-dependent thymidylate synthase, partial [Desulfuromonadaceae bacterium]